MTAEQRFLGYRLELEDFVDARKGWQMKGEGQNRHARRVFDYGRRGQVVLSMRLQEHDLRYEPFAAQIAARFSAGPEESVVGRWPTVDPWIAEAERALSVPARLAECRTAEHAQLMVGKVPGRDLRRLGFYLEIENDLTAIRRDLVREFAPKGRR